MKVVLKSLGLVALFIGSASAAVAGSYGAAGCGLGSIVFGSQAGFVQVFAATTNGTSGSQTFGISSGTSNCVPASKAEAFNKQREFVNTNLASLASEMSQGNGETLAAFTQTLGCEANLGVVTKTLQAGAGKIFKETSTDAVLFATYDVLKGSSEASVACKDII
jgi:hypothetical protein